MSRMVRVAQLQWPKGNIMEILDFAEKQGQRSAAFSLETLELMSKRATTLLTLLLGGAGATGAYALGQIGKPGSLWALCALGAVSLWWFSLAAWVTVCAMKTQVVSAPAGGGLALLEQAKKYDDYIKQAKIEGESPADCLTLLREMELRILMKSQDGYRNASALTARALDVAYIGAAATPAFAVAGLAIAWLLAR